MSLGVSIIICCYNSADRLPETLKHIANQVYIEKIPVELILVNNNSTDETKSVAAIEWNKYQSTIELKVVDEPEPGLSAAREKGVRSAAYEYILFCDDDNWLNNDYLKFAFDLLNSLPGVGVLGGQSIGVSDIDFPEWWEENQGGYAIGKQAEFSGDVSGRFYLWGAGMVSRRSLLLKVFNNQFPLLLSDRKANELVSGGDSEICMRILLLGFTLYYDERLFFKHYMTPGRIKMEYYQKLRDSFVTSSHILNKYKTAIGVFKLPVTQRLVQSFQNIVGLVTTTLGMTKKHRAELLNQVALCLCQPGLTRDQDYKRIIEFRNRYAE